MKYIESVEATHVDIELGMSLAIVECMKKHNVTHDKIVISFLNKEFLDEYGYKTKLNYEITIKS
jgi:hypothetical protein